MTLPGTETSVLCRRIGSFLHTWNLGGNVRKCPWGQQGGDGHRSMCSLEGGHSSRGLKERLFRGVVNRESGAGVGGDPY